MEFKQAFVLFGMLSFLGTFCVITGTAVVVICARLIGEERLARCFSVGSGWLFGGRGLAWKIMMAALVIVFGYSATLFGASLASQELTLAPGSEKYFCEVDCHLAYSVTGVQSATVIDGGESSPLRVQGNFAIVSVRTRFDENTISRHRGNGPLDPSPREITLVDEGGHCYPISQAGQQALSDSEQAGPSMMQALRPGESYISKLVFEVPRDSRNLRLFIDSPTEPRWIGQVLIGSEDSVLHKKVYLALPAAAPR
jgi:hypothetical protein